MFFLSEFLDVSCPRWPCDEGTEMRKIALNDLHWMDLESGLCAGSDWLMGREGGWREGGGRREEGRGGGKAVKYVMYKQRSFSLTHTYTFKHTQCSHYSVPRENCELCMSACLLSYPHICPHPPPYLPHVCTETHRVEAQNIHHFISRLTAVRGLASCVNNSLM